MRVAPTLAAIVVLVATFGAQADAEAKPSKADRKKAIQLFKKSQEAYQAGHFDEAAQLLEEAYQLDPNPILLFNLARAKESTGDVDGTIEAYRRYLEAAPGAKDRTAFESRIQNLEAQLEKRKKLEQKAEEERKRREALEQAPPPPPREIAPPPPPAKTIEPKSPSPWPWVVLGIGAVGAGTGGILGAMAQSKSSSAKDEPVQETAADLDASAHSLALGANVAYGVGGGIALAGLIWGIVDLASGGETEKSVTVGPTASKSSFGIAGRF